MPTIEQVLEAELIPEQRAAATDTSREVITLACAGSGKSRTLAYRIAWLVGTGVDPRGIVAFTFTDKAADSMKRQVSKALTACGLEPLTLGAMYIGTIHSYCYYILSLIDAKYRQFDVLDDNRLRLYLISRYSQLGLQHLRHARNANYFQTIREVTDAWKILNDEVVSIEHVSQHDGQLGLILENLAERLNQDNFIDFSQMIRIVVEGLQHGDANAERAVSDLKHLMVDEYQDVNPSQEALIQRLHARSDTLFVVGDDDQAIYGWRGADVGNILTFQQRYPGASYHPLNFNFRSTPAIVETADTFITAELGPTRINKNPEAEEPPGSRDFRSLWFHLRPDEADWVVSRIQALLGTSYHETTGQVRGLTPGDFAILMRSTRQDEQSGSPYHAAFTRRLENANIPFTLESGGGVFERPHVQVLRDIFELLRIRPPTREEAQGFFDSRVLPSFPESDFNRFTQVLRDWGRLIHAPITGPRRRVYPQQLVHDLLGSLGVGQTHFDPGTLHDLGVFSKIMQDVEAVYVSIDTAQRFQEILNFLSQVAETGYDISTENVLRRPDAVMVSTVHKAKGLEFPVVFLVDVENGRFPLRRRNYHGWLPLNVIQPALDRGAYQSISAEEARLFYTALTRAERYLYVTGSEFLPGGVMQRKPSTFCQRLSHSELSDDSSGLPNGLTTCEQFPRIDEAVVPTTYSDIRYYLRCPADYRFRKIFGFSPPITEMFGYGMTIHAAIGKLHQRYEDQAPTAEDTESIVFETFHLKHVPPSGDPELRPGPYERARERATDILGDYVDRYSADFETERQVEIRFEIPLENAVITGTIDLILRYDEENNLIEATVIDFKALEGGEQPTESDELDWSELALQVQLYVKAAREVLGERARTGAVHLLKDNQRIQVPVGDAAVEAAIANVEWAVERILEGDFPRRPHADKCNSCDFRQLCERTPEDFRTLGLPPAIHLPGTHVTKLARAFSEFNPS